MSCCPTCGKESPGYDSRPRKVAVHDVVDVIDQFVAIVGVPGKNRDRPRFYVRFGKLLPINVVCPPILFKTFTE